jgi:putative oxidoreductase
MKTLIPSRVASIIFAIAIGAFGIRNFVKADSMDAIVPDYMPGGSIWLYITGVCLILAAIAIILNNRFTRLACYLLALMLIIFVFVLHLKPALSGNPNNLLRDTAIAMGAIVIGNLTPARRTILTR